MKNRLQPTETLAPATDLLNRSSWRYGLLLIPLALASFALVLSARGVSPPPDGGYFNGNTAEGEDALFHLVVSLSHFDTAIGFHALFNDNGGLNTAVGAGALKSNTSGIGQCRRRLWRHSLTT